MRTKMAMVSAIMCVAFFGGALAAHAEPPKHTPGWFQQNTGNPQPGFKPGGMPPGQFPGGR